jgi:hypothetical protein
MSRLRASGSVPSAPFSVRLSRTSVRILCNNRSVSRGGRIARGLDGVRPAAGLGCRATARYGAEATGNTGCDRHADHDRGPRSAMFMSPDLARRVVYAFE